MFKSLWMNDNMESKDYVDYISIFHLLNDYDNLTNLCRERLIQTIELHIDEYKSDKVDDIIIDYAHDQVLDDLKPMINDFIGILSNKSSEKVDGIDFIMHYSTISGCIIDCIVDELHFLYENKAFIPRSYPFEYSSIKKPTIFNNKNNKKKLYAIIDQIHYLYNVPQPKQRTDEWYEFRHNCITASSAWKILDTQKQRENYINSKIVDSTKTQSSRRENVESPFHHGHKYEPLSTMLYERINNTLVGEFGCIKHKDHYFIGASPDGININSKSDKYGTLLEIKNVVSRDITGIPKKEYWIQMQMQMEVCDLDYCDFLETKFVEYESEEAFLDDFELKAESKGNIDFSKNKAGQYIGLMVMFYVKDEPIYEYCPLSNIKPLDIIAWKDDIINKYANTVENSSWVDNIYWKCEKYSCVCVERNRKWFENALASFRKIWTLIEETRNEEEPAIVGKDDVKRIKRKKKASYESDILSGRGGVCLIKLD